MVRSSPALRSSLTMATEKASFPPPPPLSWKMSEGSVPRVRVRVRVSSSITFWKCQIPWIHLMLFLFNLVTVSSERTMTTSSSYASQISYRDHCNSVVPESTLRELKFIQGDILMIRNGYFVGGDRILGNNSQLSFNFPRYVSFRPRNVYQTEAPGVLMVEGNLNFGSPHTYSYSGNSTYGRSLSGRLRHRSPRFPVRRGGANFRLRGFWSASTGKLCMVGSSMSYSKKEGKFLEISGVFKLAYPENSTLLTSLVTGTLESVDTVDSLKYFEPISILAFSQSRYEYSLINKEIDNGFSSTTDSGEQELSLSLQSRKGICSILRRPANAFELKYRGDCDAAATNCTPLGRSMGFFPGFMSFGGVHCSNEQKMRLLLVFSNISFIGYNEPFDPKMTLVGEGAWDGEKNQLRVVACRILNFTDSLTRASVGGCSIRLNLRFPTALSIRNRSTVVGQIWSNATANDSSYFDRVIFQAPEDRSPAVPGLKYEYTMMGGLSKLCEIKSVKNRGKIYPDGYSSDMKFDMSVKNDLGQLAWGYATPLFVGDQFYENSRRSFVLESDEKGAVFEVSTHNHSSQLNVSYTIDFTIPPESKFGGGFLPSTYIAISGEGIYNGETGSLCMVGCRALDSNHKISAKNDSIDCEISINVQFPPLDAKIGSHVKGTIKSTREESHHLYFKSLELSSSGIYFQQAEESLWRMDLEIAMVLISNTLACVFIGLQLLYVKKHLDMVPFISLVMLFTLTLGLMIPLLLNFEALFMADHNRQNVFLGSGGWLEVNEVIVRAVTMVAFLLQFRLLQQAWSTRWSDGSHKGLWTAEIKALYVTLPLYLLGGLIAWFVHWKHNYDEARIIRTDFVANYQQHSLWGDMRSYAGLLLDGFLLPQILFNLFLNSKEKALAPSFYVGTTVVRLLPHAYDLYRAHKYAHSFDVSYIYASHGVDFFSTAWDVIIPCGGMLFAIIIYVQQRFGGHCILPSKFRESVLYEKVPVVSS